MRLPHIVIDDRVVPISVASYTFENKPSNPKYGDYYFQTDGIIGLYKYTGLKWDHMGDSIQPADPFTVDYSNKKLIKSSFVGDLENLTGKSRYYPESDILIKQMFASIGGASNTHTFIRLYKNGTTQLHEVYLAPNSYKTQVIDVNFKLTPADYLTVDLVADGGSDLLFTMIYYTINYSQI